MSSFHLKLLAILTMTVDHIGLFLFPQHLEFRIIGRLAFPLFAYLIANGAYHTGNINKYLLRLLGFAFISQPIFLLIHSMYEPSFWALNIFFTLVLGLSGIFVLKSTNDKAIQFIIIIFMLITADILKTDYGSMGVMSIIAFYLFYNNFKKMLLSQFIIFTVPQFTNLYFLSLEYGKFVLTDFDIIRPLALLSLVFIYFYNQKKGPSLKYLFYIFYPLHLLVIFFIAKFIR